MQVTRFFFFSSGRSPCSLSVILRRRHFKVLESCNLMMTSYDSSRLKEEPFGAHNKRPRQLSSNGVQMPLRFDNSHEIFRERLDRIDRFLQPEPRCEAVDDVLRNIHNVSVGLQARFEGFRRFW